VVPFYGPREGRKTKFPRVKDIEDLGDKLAGDLYNTLKFFLVPFYGPREGRKTKFPRVKDIEDLGDKLAGDLYNTEKLRKRTWGLLFLIIERKIWRS